MAPAAPAAREPKAAWTDAPTPRTVHGAGGAQASPAPFAWARPEAALPADLDLEHLAEEVEDLGRSELRAVESLIRLIPAHVAKIASVPDAPAVPRWRTEIVTWHNDLPAALSPAMAQRLDLDVPWRRALKEAASALAERGDTLRPDLPEDGAARHGAVAGRGLYAGHGAGRPR